jgi:acylphosphatase
MKLMVTITGPKVHDVGYRHFLMISALNLGLSGFHARNRTDGVEQGVIALAEGDEEAIADFRRFVETRKPERSEVSNIAFEDYEGDVMRAGEYAQVCKALQLIKAFSHPAGDPG